eukprot:Platyproteum_vivax@DN14075_c0_g1_i1.p1
MVGGKSSVETVMVTGGTGLVGNGIKSAIASVLGGDSSKLNFVWLSSKDGDLRDRAATKALFELHKPDHVIHLSARVGGLFANMNDQIGFLRDNLAMNDNVVTLCHEYNVKRAIFCLSTCVYPAEGKLPYTEGTIHDGPPHKTNEGYAHAKRILECLIRYYRETYKHEWFCIIPTNLYGPHDNFNLEDSHVIPGLMHKCLLAQRCNESWKLMGTGTPYRQFIYSKDAGIIILRLLQAPKDKVDFSSVILCADADQEFTIKYVSEQIAKSMQFSGKMDWDTSKSDGILKKTACNARLRQFLGNDFKFTPLEKGMEETAEWFKANYDTPAVRK